MPRPKWPATPEERSDRTQVLRAIVSLGHRQLRFTVDDVRRELTNNLGKTLHHPRQLGRHVAALEPISVISVGQPLLAFVLQPDHGAPRTASAGDKSRHLYALPERAGELARTAPDLTDAARVYVALWIAVRVYGADAVSTHAVTEICQVIPALHVDTGQQMSTRLKSLADRGIPLVATERPLAADETTPQWTRWRPVGRRPEDAEFEAAVPTFETWVALARTLKGNAPDLGGYATTHELVADLVTMAILSTRSTHWPAGHPVTVEHIRSVCAEHAEARELRERLERMGTTIGRVLGDISKARIVGRARVSRRVVKVGTIQGEQTSYDVPALKGFAGRELYVPLEQLRADASSDRLHALTREFRAAEALTARVACFEAAQALAAIRAVRMLLVAREIAGLDARVAALVERRHELSTPAEHILLSVADQLRNIHNIGGMDAAAAGDAARAAVAPLGADLDLILQSPPPILLGDEYPAWIPAAVRGMRSGAELMADATTVRRHPNPRYVHRRAADRDATASTGLDRVDALLHLAERQRATTLAFLQGGARLLGPMLREGSLVRTLLAANDSRYWSDALAALALLGDPEAERAAHAWLAIGRYADRMVPSLYALAVMRRADGPWPEALVDSEDSLVIGALRAVLDAKETGRWLL